MMKNYELGEVEILDITLTNHDGSIKRGIAGQVFSIDIFEDINECSMYAEFTLIDAVNLIDNFAMIGEETVSISFRSPWRDDIITYDFYAYSISPTSDVNGRASVYILKCTTYDYMFNCSRVIDKSYNTTIDEIVYDLIKKELNTKKDVFIEPTRGIVPERIPKLSPLGAVNYLKQKAVSKRATGGVYCFYENQYGYYFKSIEKIIEDGASTVNSFTFYAIANPHFSDNIEDVKIRNILQYSHVNRYNSLMKASQGVYKSKINSFDLLTNSIQSTDYNFNENKSKFEAGQKSMLQVSSKFANLIGSGDPLQMLVPNDRSRPLNNLPGVMGMKNAYEALFNDNIVRLKIIGDSQLAVGDTITLNLPDTSGFDIAKQTSDRTSGKYIVSRLRHMIEASGNKFLHYIALDCNRIGMGV